MAVRKGCGLGDQAEGGGAVVIGFCATMQANQEAIQ